MSRSIDIKVFKQPTCRSYWVKVQTGEQVIYEGMTSTPKQTIKNVLDDLILNMAVNGI